MRVICWLPAGDLSTHGVWDQCCCLAVNEYGGNNGTHGLAWRMTRIWRWGSSQWMKPTNEVMITHINGLIYLTMSWLCAEFQEHPCSPWSLLSLNTTVCPKGYKIASMSLIPTSIAQWRSLTEFASHFLSRSLSKPLSFGEQLLYPLLYVQSGFSVNIEPNYLMSPGNSAVILSWMLAVWYPEVCKN